MNFLVDNALSPKIANGLLKNGYDAKHVRDIGMAASKDPEILDRAALEDRILISADTDFGGLLAFREATKPSFILFRQSDKRPSSQLNYLLTHLPRLEKDLTSGCVVVIEDQRIRVRSLPISKSS